MSAINDGGSAFPGTNQARAQTVIQRMMRAALAEDTAGMAAAAVDMSECMEPGMSLRDFFAAQALAVVTQADHIDGLGDPERHATRAYQYADAMLKARKAQS